MTARTFRFSWDFIENVSNRIAGELRGVARVFVDGQYLSKAVATPPTITRALAFSTLTAEEMGPGADWTSLFKAPCNNRNGVISMQKVLGDDCRLAGGNIWI